MNDGCMYSALGDRPTQWGDLPPNYHSSACGYAFADGHSEIKAWQGPNMRAKKVQYRDYSTLTPVLLNNATDTRDHQWHLARTSALK